MMPFKRVDLKDNKMAVSISILLILHKMNFDNARGNIWLSICCWDSPASINLLTPEYIQSNTSSAIANWLSVFFVPCGFIT